MNIPTDSLTYLDPKTFLGMTLRDYFAACALTTQMMFAADEVDSDTCCEVARMSYKIADAMMEARK